MNRLTKIQNQYPSLTDPECEYIFSDNDISICEIVNKLGELEDLETALECPLDVFIKAICTGFYYYIEDMDYIEYCDPRHLRVESFDHKMCFMNVKGFKIRLDNQNNSSYYEEKEVVFLNKYNKTWWLDKPLKKPDQDLEYEVDE